MLALPRAAAEYELPFAGAVAAPGVFQLGPLDRMQRYLYEEMEVALRSGDRAFTRRRLSAGANRPGSSAAECASACFAQCSISTRPFIFFAHEAER
jgi:hypothetical protein